MSFKISASNIKLFSYFIILMIFGTFLLQLPIAYVSSNPPSLIDSVFTSVSAICVTGLSTLSMDVYTKFGFFFIMILIEFGGLGIIAFVSVFLAIPLKKVSSANRKLVKDFFIDEVESNPRKILKNIIGYTLGIQIIFAVFLIFSLKNIGVENFVFEGFFFSISAFCNAGFSPYASSLANFQLFPSFIVPIMLLIVLGGLGFIVIENIVQVISYKFFKRNKHTIGTSQRMRLTLHSKIVLIMTSFLIVFPMIFFLIFEYDAAFKELSFSQKIMAAFFQSITPRTAGFETISQSNFSDVSELITNFLMFVGGSSGSIAGGVKTSTVLIVFLYAFNGNESRNLLNLFNRTLDSSIINRATTIVARSLIFISISILFVSVFERTALSSGKITISDILFECVSAFSTVGLSQGITSSLSFAGKLIIILTMFIGRTGIFAMALHLSVRNEIPDIVEYPNDQVLVG